MTSDRRWSDTDRELVERAWRSTSGVRLDGIEMMISDAMRAADVLDALTAVGWRDVHDLEKPDSILCDCDPTPEHQPTNPRTGTPMDHHCDCTAVETVAQLLGENATVHARQCVCRPDGGTDE